MTSTLTPQTSKILDNAILAESLGGTVKICGTWVWVKFPKKPDSHILDQMKSAGFSWSRAKHKWYFIGSQNTLSKSKKRFSWKEITNFHPPLSIEDFQSSLTTS